MSRWARATCAAALLAVLAGCDINEFITGDTLASADDLQEQYDDLSPGTFAFRRRTSLSDQGRLYEGAAGYDAPTAFTSRVVCMPLNRGTATLTSLDLIRPIRGSRIDITFVLPETEEFSGQSYAFVTDTTGGVISAVFTARMTRGGPYTPERYTSVIEGGFRAVFNPTCERVDPGSTRPPQAQQP